MKVYIAGKITGDPQYRSKFAKAAEKIKYTLQKENLKLLFETIREAVAAGKDRAILADELIERIEAIPEIVILNPAILPHGLEHSDYMHIDFAMIDVADKVYFLPCWTDSPGAKMELEYCRQKNKEMEFVSW